MIKLKTFKDLKFKPYRFHLSSQANIKFNNGHGIAVATGGGFDLPDSKLFFLMIFKDDTPIRSVALNNIEQVNFYLKEVQGYNKTNKK